MSLSTSIKRFCLVVRVSAPVYKCGVRTGVSNLNPGGPVSITAHSVKVGDVNGCAPHQGVNVTPTYGLTQKVQAFLNCTKTRARRPSNTLRKVRPTSFSRPRSRLYGDIDPM